MVGIVKHANLKTKTARTDDINVGEAITYDTLIPGKVHIGYRRLRGKPGEWWGRWYIGKNGTKAPYKLKKMGTADDYSPADGDSILSYEQAKAKIEGVKTGNAKVVTVAEAFEDYFENRRKLGSDTHIDEGKVRNYVLGYLGPQRIADLTKGELTKWRNTVVSMPARYRGPLGQVGRERESSERARRASANKIVTLLKAALNHAYGNDKAIAESDYAWKKLASFEDVDAARPEYLELEDALRLINAADPESGFRDLLRAALETGCRYGELTRLKVGDFKNGQIDIHESKSGKPRSVVLSDDGESFFRQLVMGRAKGETMLLNKAAEGGPREWRKSEQNRPMRKACEAARMPYVHFHAMRHTWASLSVMAGLPLIVVAQNLGHSNTRMVEQHYGHLSKGYVKDMIKGMAPRFGAVKPGKVASIRRG